MRNNDNDGNYNNVYIVYIERQKDNIVFEPVWNCFDKNQELKKMNWKIDMDQKENNRLPEHELIDSADYKQEKEKYYHRHAVNECNTWYRIVYIEYI